MSALQTAPQIPGTRMTDSDGNNHALFTGPGYEVIHDWLVSCLRATPDIYRRMRGDGFTDAQVLEHLYSGAGHRDMPREWLQLWRATLQLWGGDEQARTWLASKPVQVQEFFTSVLEAGGVLDIQTGDVNGFDGLHRHVAR